MSGPAVTPGSAEWLALVDEDIVEPDQPIIDTHHHFWEKPVLLGRYVLEDFWADAGSGHRIEKSVFIECRCEYLDEGPEHLRPVGETEYVARLAAESAERPERPTVAGIVAHADLALGDALVEVLDAHQEAGRGLFRGIRHAGAHDTTSTLLNSGRGKPCPYGRDEFRAGVRLLGRLGYTYDTWHFYHQNRDFLELARSAPHTLIVLDHFGTPLGTGAYAGRRDEIFEIWRRDIAAIARCDNVVAKLGGLAMPDNGFGWHERSRPPSSDEFVAAQRAYYLHTIECFGPDRCLFESNFPVDKLSISYPVMWNGMKKMIAGFSESEKHALFYGTAQRVYNL